MDCDPDEPDTMPSDCQPFEGVNPLDGTNWNLYVREKSMKEAVMRGPGVVRELAYTVPDAVLQCRSVFLGDRDEGEPDWLCYVSVPDSCYDYKTGDSRRAWFGKVFVVKFDQYRILRWFGWIKEEKHEERFDKKVM